MKYDKKTLIGAGIVGLLVVIALVSMLRHKKAEAPMQAPSVIVNMPETKASPVVAHMKKTPSDMTEHMSYAEAFAMYSHGNIIQFDDACQSHPMSLFMTNGSKVMLDNRSTHSETITLGDTSYSMKPFDFKIVTIRIPHVPTTYTIDCKTAQNVTTLTIE